MIERHRTVETYVMGLLAAGFALAALREPLPVDGVDAPVPDLDRRRRRPPFPLPAGKLGG